MDAVGWTVIAVGIALDRRGRLMYTGRPALSTVTEICVKVNAKSVQTPVPIAVFVQVLKKKMMMAVVAVRNRVCAVLQTAVGAVVCVHSRVGVHSLRAGVASGGSLG